MYSKYQGFGAGAVTLARLRLHLKIGICLVIHENHMELNIFSKVNIKYGLHVLVHVLELILNNS